MTKLRSECFCNSHESFFATELGVKKGVTFLEAYGLELNDDIWLELPEFIFVCAFLF